MFRGPMGGSTHRLDWWYERYEGYKTYSPIPMWKYRWMFPYNMDPAPLGRGPRAIQRRTMTV